MGSAEFSKLVCTMEEEGLVGFCHMYEGELRFTVVLVLKFGEDEMLDGYGGIGFGCRMVRLSCLLVIEMVLFCMDASILGLESNRVS